MDVLCGGSGLVNRGVERVLEEPKDSSISSFVLCFFFCFHFPIHVTGSSASFCAHFKRFSLTFFPPLPPHLADVKLVHDARVRTYSGALVTLCAVTIIVTLCASEVSIFMEPHVREHLRVDFGKSKKMKIDFDIEFPHIPCSLLSLDAMDVSGSHQDDLTHHIKKTPLGKDGKPVDPMQYLPKQ